MIVSHFFNTQFLGKSRDEIGKHFYVFVILLQFNFDDFCNFK